MRTTKQIETLSECSVYETETSRHTNEVNRMNLKAELTPVCAHTHTHSLTFLIQASPASCSSLFVEFRALKRAAMIFSLD